MTRAVQAAKGFTRCAVAVHNENCGSGVVTFLSERQISAVMTETAAPVSTSATVRTPSTDTSITFVGLLQFESRAALASGTAAASFPVQLGLNDVASAIVSGDVGSLNGGYRRHDG